MSICYTCECKGNQTELETHVLRDSKQTWTIDGKIFIKDRIDAIHRANSETELTDMMNKLNITVTVVECKRRK